MRPEAGQRCPHLGLGAFGSGLAYRPGMCISRKAAAGIWGALLQP